MTNKERYQHAFAPLRSSTNTMEVWNMNQSTKQKHTRFKLLLLAALLAVMAVCSAFAVRHYLTLVVGGEAHLLQEMDAPDGQSAYLETGQDGPTAYFAVGKSSGGGSVDKEQLEEALSELLNGESSAMEEEAR